jgi:hypothetical protein
MWWSRIALAAALAAPITVLSAQTPGALSGIVRDSAGRPLREAVVVLDPNDDIRATRTDAAGRFRFDRLRAKRYVMRTTWIGYQADERTIELPAGGLEVTITLTRLTFRLDTMTVVARRTGIFGTAIDKQSFHPLGGVDIWIAGTSHRARTSSDGRFSFPELTEGGFLVMGRRDGYETISLAVAVPDTAAIELALVMDSLRTRAQQRENVLFQDLQMRINRGQINSSALVVFQEFAERKRQTLDIALRYSPSFLAKGLVLKNVECIYIDGLPKPSILAKDILAEDVAMVEIYNHRGAVALADRQLFRNNGNDCGVGSVQEVYGPRGAAMRSVRPPNPATVAFIFIWLR